ncbi:unnamed protein product [Rotaria sp. Silwood1]|nr:unnamed protein product [Rotaria sp. Silwood1]CAF1606804.1 unnamed protein product [Rotaria sp. Silwood1]CAF3833179.1 unnamed protein product [Rotaria sp. Silwood1]CAF4868899.1 unnamed protein product [Rotaria sp. Silwood1]
MYVDKISQHSTIIRTTNNQHYCHRELPLRICFYGDKCQYQNQRVALTIEFQVFFHLKRISFAIVITLIDDSDRQIIHSYQQLTYLSMQHYQIKFNIYLFNLFYTT